jgi:hypothetical protein
MSAIEERFWSHVDKSGECWLWTASKANKGYGQFVRIHGKSPARAHRFAWELVNGPIPQGLCVLHHCDTPACVRPEHLFLGTKADNNADMRAKGRHATAATYRGSGGWLRGEAVCTSKLTNAAVRDIRRRGGPYGTLSAIAREYGLSVSAIFGVVHGKTWRHVT